MAYTIKVKSVEATLTMGDNYGVAATCELYDNGVLVDIRIISVAGFRYETDNLKQSIINKLREAIVIWKADIKTQAAFRNLLNTITTDLEG